MLLMIKIIRILPTFYRRENTEVKYKRSLRNDLNPNRLRVSQFKSLEFPLLLISEINLRRTEGIHKIIMYS